MSGGRVQISFECPVDNVDQSLLVLLAKQRVDEGVSSCFAVGEALTHNSPVIVHRHEGQ